MLTGCTRGVEQNQCRIAHYIPVMSSVPTVSYQQFEAYQIFAEQNSVCIICFLSDKTKFPVFQVAKN